MKHGDRGGRIGGVRMGRQSGLAREIPRWLNAVLVFGTMAAVVALELKRPLRRSRDDKMRRDLRNFAIAATSAATVSLAEKPITAPLSLAVQRNRWGLLKMARLPAPVELVLSVLLLDYTLYLWHYLTHKIPFLWRFHLPHHVDVDMDASTALRFHFGEILLSVPWRSAQVLLLGVSPRALSLWQALTLAAIQFHHSNLRLPFSAERRLCRLVVTPRMHGIHHSVVRRETDSNWSTIFSWPDYLHRTVRLNVPQDAITVGVPAYRNPSELSFWGFLKLPFVKDRPSWKVTEAAERLSPLAAGLAREPDREPPSIPRRKLAQ